MQGRVFKIHSDFYYVKTDGGDLLECKLREVLKKQNTRVYVNDIVQIEENSVIYKVNKRKNFLPRPSVANLDLMVVVSSLLEPKLDFVQLNRYLIFLKYNKIPAVLCFNKEDLMENDDFEQTKEEIKNIYEPLKYKFIFTSAKEKNGLIEFKKTLKGKTVALCGLSGVGKSSILNALNPDLKIKTKTVSTKTERGVHTTRHVEIMEFKDFNIIDTPGFSNLKFDFLLPQQLGDLFDEIKSRKNLCKFKDCLHVNEEGCNVIKNSDNINIARYQSYIEFLKEAQEYKKQISKRGNKKELSHKVSHGKIKLKLNRRKRENSRNTLKQQVKAQEE